MQIALGDRPTKITRESRQLRIRKLLLDSQSPAFLIDQKGFPLNRKTSSTIRMITTVNSRKKARLKELEAKK